MVRVRRRHLDPNPKDPLWSLFRSKDLEKNSEIPLLLDYDYLDSVQDEKFSPTCDDPIVPLPAFYQPPIEVQNEVVQIPRFFQHHYPPPNVSISQHTQCISNEIENTFNGTFAG